MVDEGIATIVDVLNAVAGAFGENPTNYQHIAPKMEVESLLYVLRDGVEVHNQREARFRSGTPAPMIGSHDRSRTGRRD